MRTTSKAKWLLYFFMSISIGAIASPIDSLSLALEQQLAHHEIKEAIPTCLKLALSYFENDNISKSIEQYNRALDLAKKAEDSQLIADALFDLAWMHAKVNNYQTALKYYFQVIELPDNSIQQSDKVRTYSQIGTVYQELGEYKKAYEYQIKSLEQNEIAKDSTGIARAYYSLGTLFFYQDQYGQALNYYKKAQEICNKLGNQRLIYSCLAALGSVYDELGDYDKSYDYSLQSLALAEKINYKTGIAYSLNNISSDLIRKGAIEAAKEKVLQSIQLKKEINDQWATIGSLQALADIYLKLEDKEKAIATLQEAKKLAEKIGSKPRLLEVSEKFANLYQSEEQYDKAYFYLQEHLVLKDSVLNEKTVEEMGQTQTRYEVQKRENEIALLKKEKEVFVQQKEIQQLYRYLLIGAALLLFIICIAIFNRYFYQKQVNDLLEEKNQKIQSQNEKLALVHEQQKEMNQLLEEKNILLKAKNQEINISNKQLESSNEDLKHFAYVASHDLKEPLRMINAYTNLLQRRYHNVLDDSGKEFMHFIVDGVSRMSTLLDDLLTYSRVGRKEEPNNWIATNDVLFIVLSNLRTRIDEKNAILKVSEERLPKIKANRSQLNQLFQNLISNALKFTNGRQPEISIDCEQQNQQFVFSVKDNGIGIAEEYQDRVFEMFRRLHTREEYEGTGIGLATCKKIVERHGGDIWLTSERGVGTTFYFSIPIVVEQETNLVEV